MRRPCSKRLALASGRTPTTWTISMRGSSMRWLVRQPIRTPSRVASDLTRPHYRRASPVWSSAEKSPSRVMAASCGGKPWLPLPRLETDDRADRSPHGARDAPERHPDGNVEERLVKED